jgi:predicted GIY-YIG superfamily endonuclease
VYIAASVKDAFYVGMALDPVKRLAKHNSGHGSQFARDRGELRLVYISVPYPSKSIAIKREIQLKGWSRAKKLKLMSGEWK